MLIITHGMPKNLRIDGVLQMNKAGGHEFRLLTGKPDLDEPLNRKQEKT
jgi:hypothetical protein